MNDKITFLTREQNIYFLEKLKLNVLILGILSMGNMILPAVIVLPKWKEVIGKISGLSLGGIVPLLLLFIEYLFAVSAFCQCLRIWSAIKEQKDLYPYGRFCIGRIQDRYQRRGKTGELCREELRNGGNRSFTI